MPILYDAVITFLCCAGIVATFIALFIPRKKESTHIAGVVVSEDAIDIAKCAMALRSMFDDVIVVTEQDLTEVIGDITVLSPEEFEAYVTGIN